MTRPPKVPRKGTVRFIGKVHLKPGLWVGVQYDEPLGKNDGSLDDQRYFTCPKKYGSFVRPALVQKCPAEDSDDEM